MMSTLQVHVVMTDAALPGAAQHDLDCLAERPIGGRANSIRDDHKRRFSQSVCEVCCNQEYACGLQQGLDDEATPVITQAEPLVLEQPGDGALNGPAPPPSPEPGGRLRWWMNGSAC
jgi:hypothetical protein